MKPDRWQEIDDLLQLTLSERPSQRILFLSKACKTDESLRLEVESLLAAHEEAGDFLEKSLSHTAADLLITGQRESVIGQTVGSYRIVKSLGAGGMGEVYLADDQRLGRKVALKLLPDYLIDDQSRRRRFTQEARSASSLNHPNIVTIYEIGEADGHHFIATEFIEGETLRQHMIRVRASVEEVLGIAVQVASALAAAHKRGVVHRDIKPENIMIRPDGYVKILDFGLAKLGENPFGDSNLESSTATIKAIDSIPGIILGTVTYMSPEQARGLPVDVRTDLWSLGVVLYEMLTTKAPFCGETPADIIVSILEKEPPHFDLDTSVPFRLTRIINKALRKNRETRYQTADELALDLRIVKQGLNAQPRTETLAEPSLVGSLHAASSADEIHLSSSGPSVPGDSSLAIPDGRYGKPLKTAHSESSTTVTSHEFLPSRSLADSARRVRTNPFVGREKDVAHLEGLLRKASSGSGRLVFITGETGIGKTTLADEFRQRTRQQYPTLFLARGRCVEQYGTGEAYLPFLDALSGLLTGPGWEHIAAILRTYAPTWCLQLPATFISGKDLERLQYETIGATKRRMVREMGDALSLLTATASMLLVLEDLHWADPSSTDLLQYLSQRVSDRRLLIVGTFRPEDLAVNNHPLKNYKLEMEAHSLCDEIALTSFNYEHIASYLNERFDNHNFPSELTALIQRKTEGHPLFATSLVQFLVDREDITKTDGRWSLARPLADLEMVAPESVRSMILKKIESVTGDDKRILQYASIEGEEFTSTVVANLIAVDAVTVEERLDHLDKIHRLIDTRGEESLPDGTLTVRYRFAHAIYQNLLYETLIPRRRRLLHLQAGEQLTARYGNASAGIATQLAMHFERGGDLTRAIQYLMQAGDNAIKLYANAEAERHYSHAILLVEKLPENEQVALQLDLYHRRGRANLALTQLKPAEDDFAQMRLVARAAGATASECVALNALADTFFYSHRIKEMRACAVEALQVAERLNDTASRIEAMVGLGMTCTGSGELAEGKRLLDAAILAARGRNPSSALIRGLIYRGILHYFQTEYDAAEKLLTEAVSLASELQNGFMLLHSRFFLALNFGNQGRISDALRGLRETMEMAERDGDRIVLARIPNSIGWIHRELGDLVEAIALDKESCDIARAHHVTEAEANSLINLSHDHTMRHNGDSSLGALNDAESVFEREQWNHWRFHHIRFHAGAAEHYLSQGNYNKARQHADTLLENATRYEVPKYMAIAHKLIAGILCACGHLMDAEAQLCVGLSKLETHPAPLLSWQIYGQLGELRRQLGDRVGAHEAFCQAADIVDSIATEVIDDRLRTVFLNSSSVQAVRTGAVNN